MKTFYYILFYLLLFSSCTNYEKDIFDASPAERMNKSISDSFKTLISSENGWVMEYFPNTESGGYNLLVKFNASGQASFSAHNELTKNGAYEQDSCLFDIISDNGPVLTFNTFNKVLHRFSNPENPDGYGLQGDYEFIIIKNEGDNIILKGKKYASTIKLKKIALGVNWKNYLLDIDILTKQLFSESSPKLTLTTAKTSFTFKYIFKPEDGFKRKFEVKKEGQASFSLNIPFIVQSNGIRFQEMTEIDGLKFQNFTLNSEKSALISVENPLYKIAGVDDLALYFMNNLKTWEIDIQNSSSIFKSNYDEIVTACKKNYNAENIKLSLKYLDIRRNFVLTLTFMQGTNANEGNIDLTVSSTNQDVLQFLNKATGDVNGFKYLNEVKGLTDFATLLSTSFDLITNCKIYPKTIKLTKKQDTSLWLTIKDI